MTKDELIKALQELDVPGDAPVKINFNIDIILVTPITRGDGSGFVTIIGESNSNEPLH